MRRQDSKHATANAEVARGKKRKTRRVRRGVPASARQGAQMPAGKFKARCLALMDRVNETGEEIVITKHNRPVARLVPILEQSPKPFVGRMKGTVQIRGDLVAPINADWDLDADY